jgi:hypothetical protein
VTQTVKPEEQTAEVREAVRTQLLEMMQSMQEQFALPEAAAETDFDEDEGELETEESGELGEVRNFLERCFKQSA